MSEKILQQILEQITKMQNNIESIQNEIKDIKENMATKSDIKRLEKSLDKAHMESLASDEIILKTLKEKVSKIDDHEYDIQALNKRIFKVEREIERLTHQ
ncbi:hypothetical protein [Calidifontibacillus erzurumensis]|uniref:Uncharacterized protein n=1 Tax=Calidifontibacillus erzurumensis TaxID=2741433 RepID=A0A8J8GEH9_9BACI|nr:hypothetical protein [Calidifontibacillus erzurumensis]NSL51882.1 hypothetical protein [Calidifontibacillus erzurumensis]